MSDSVNYYLPAIICVGIVIMLASWRSEIPEKSKTVWLVDYMTDSPRGEWPVIVSVQAETRAGAVWAAADRLTRDGRKPIKVLKIRRAK